jgi:hypothetical protein
MGKRLTGKLKLLTAPAIASTRDKNSMESSFGSNRDQIDNHILKDLPVRGPSLLATAIASDSEGG